MAAASPHPEPSAHAATEATQPTAGVPAAPTRPSRQDLVVTPAAPRPWLAAAVVLCSLAGFATAYTLEIGRQRLDEQPADLAAAEPLQANAFPMPPSDDAAMSPPTGEGSRFAAAADGPADVVTAAAGFAETTTTAGERYATFAEDDDATGSRFGGGQLTAGVEPTTDAAGTRAAEQPWTGLEPRAPAEFDGEPQSITVRKPPVPFAPLASADLPPLEPEEPAVAEDGQAAAVAEEPPAAEPIADQPEEEMPASGTSEAIDQEADVEAEPVVGSWDADEQRVEDSGFAAAAAPEEAEPVFTEPAVAPAAAAPPSGFRAMADVEPGFARPVVDDQPLPPASGGSLAFDDPDAPIPVTPPSSPRFGSPPPADAPADAPPPSAARYASSDAIRAFGGNLPERPMLPGGAGSELMPQPPAREADPLPRSQPALAAPGFSSPAMPPQDAAPVAQPAFPGQGPGYGVTGTGRPGPAMLEGIQAPQVAVEKRGPREVQVGKFARYEILVRNVSSVTAHDVELFDTVPQGTSLVSTTPPAAPGAEGELTWQLGSLEPGEQARVLIEVLPTDEGEVGSVASVRFAAKASVRSLATRPALALEIEEPAAMRIGGEIPVVITVSNPGTGRATGVVLEGVLPEGLAHRAGRELEFDIGSLKPGESRSIDLMLSTTGPGMHRMDVGVRADGQLEEREAVVVEVTAPTLELTAELPSRRYLQRPATCVLSMANSGTAAARSVELAAQLPPGLKFVSANNAGYYDEKNHRVLWQLEELPPAEIGSVEMVVMPIALGSQQVVAAARSPDGLADQVAHVLEVEGVAALTFSVVDSEDPIEVDGVTEYVIRVGNQGTKPAGDVEVTATMLGDMQPVEASGPVDYRIENLTVVFAPLARLAPSEEVVFRVQARGRRAGDQRVQVQVTGADQQTPVTKEEVTRVYADR